MGDINYYQVGYKYKGEKRNSIKYVSITIFDNKNIIDELCKILSCNIESITIISIIREAECLACRIGQSSQWAHCEPGGCLWTPDT